MAPVSPVSRAVRRIQYSSVLRNSNVYRERNRVVPRYWRDSSVGRKRQREHVLRLVSLKSVWALAPAIADLEVRKAARLRVKGGVRDTDPCKWYARGVRLTPSGSVAMNACCERVTDTSVLPP